MNLIEIQKDIARSASESAGKAVEECREVSGMIDGVKVVTKYEHTQGRGSITTWSGVFIEGQRYGVEIDHIPWSIFNEPSVCYEVGGLMTIEQATRFLETANLQNVSIIEEYYPPLPPDPPRYFFRATTLEDVVTLWKLERG